MKNERGFAQILALLIILAGIVVGVFLATHPTVFSPKASFDGEVEFMLDSVNAIPDSATQDPNISLRIYYNPQLHIIPSPTSTISPTPAPSISAGPLTASPISLKVGGSFILSWSVPTAATCSFSSDGPLQQLSGKWTNQGKVSLKANAQGISTYNMTCQSSAGDETSGSVTVTAAPNIGPLSADASSSASAPPAPIITAGYPISFKILKDPQNSVTNFNDSSIKPIPYFPGKVLSISEINNIQGTNFQIHSGENSFLIRFYFENGSTEDAKPLGNPASPAVITYNPASASPTPIPSAVSSCPQIPIIASDYSMSYTVSGQRIANADQISWLNFIVDGNIAPVGTLVEGVDNGTIISCFQVTREGYGAFTTYGYDQNNSNATANFPEGPGAESGNVFHLLINGKPVTGIAAQSGQKIPYLINGKDIIFQSGAINISSNLSLSTTPQSPQPVPVATPGTVGQGGHCGGFIVNPSQCASGLYCVTPAGQTGDGGGTCEFTEPTPSSAPSISVSPSATLGGDGHIDITWSGMPTVTNLQADPDDISATLALASDPSKSFAYPIKLIPGQCETVNTPNIEQHLSTASGSCSILTSYIYSPTFFPSVGSSYILIVHSENSQNQIATSNPFTITGETSPAPSSTPSNSPSVSVSPGSVPLEGGQITINWSGLPSQVNSFGNPADVVPSNDLSPVYASLNLTPGNCYVTSNGLSSGPATQPSSGSCIVSIKDLYGTGLKPTAGVSYAIIIPSIAHGATYLDIRNLVAVSNPFTVVNNTTSHPSTSPFSSEATRFPIVGSSQTDTSANSTSPTSNPSLEPAINNPTESTPSNNQIINAVINVLRNFGLFNNTNNAPPSTSTPSLSPSNPPSTTVNPSSVLVGSSQPQASTPTINPAPNQGSSSLGDIIRQLLSRLGIKR